MATLDEVMNGLIPEDVPQNVDLGDMNAPESGTFLPRLKPGQVYKFKFKLAEKKEDSENPARNQPFAFVERSWPPDQKETKAKFLQVIWSAEIDPSIQRDKFVDAGEDAKPFMLNFNRAIAYKHPKMKISEVGDLLRCLGVNLNDPSIQSVQGLVAKFMELDGQGAMGEFEAGWNQYFESSMQEFTTGRPGKAYTDKDGVNHPASQPWPRNGHGAYAETVTCDGITSYGRDFVQVLKVPKA